jgi:hypothetical protein
MADLRADGETNMAMMRVAQVSGPNGPFEMKHVLADTNFEEIS